jgi:hypothetical protein
MAFQFRNTALVLVAILVAIACSSCSQDPEKVAKEQAAARQLADKDSVEALVKKYDAERVDLSKSENMDFTFQFEDAIANKSGRPIVCVGDLNDIRTEEGSLTAVMSADAGLSLFSVNFRLRCTRDQATRLASSGIWKQFAFVAKIVAVKAEEPRETCLDVKQIVVARGELIDFVILDQ